MLEHVLYKFLYVRTFFSYESARNAIHTDRIQIILKVKLNTSYPSFVPNVKFKSIYVYFRYIEK